MANSYAIVETGGKQYRAEKGTNLLVERLPANEGSKVNLRAVMFKGDKDVVLDVGQLEKVKVEAVVTEHLRGPKVKMFKYKAKKGYRRRGGHRQGLTRLEVTEVRMLTRKPTAGATTQAAKKEEPKAEAQAEAEEKPKAEAEAKAPAKPKVPAKPKAPAKKPAAKKPAARKPAAKKPAAKKPAAKKPAAKKPAAGGRTSSGGRSSSAKKES
jgi:large subunit ribosomal protein L21